VGDGSRILGDLRLARGDVDGAERAFRRAHELGCDPQPGLALVMLARGQTSGALRSREPARYLLAPVATFLAAACGDEELRDMFASAAMASLVTARAQELRKNTDNDYSHAPGAIAEVAYDMAQAMLTQRAKRKAK
jgi:hypothetical protein